jgi:hypothetical protein
MNKKLNSIRKKAIQVKENLTFGKTDDQSRIVKLNRIIRGTVLVKWMHFFAAVFYLIFAAFFTHMVYPEVKMMLILLGFAAGGYTVTLLVIVIQIKLYERTIHAIVQASKSS